MVVVEQSAVVAMTEESDEVLMLRIGKGEQQAFSTLVARHMPRVVSMAWRITGAKSDGEDVAQDAFARVWANAPRWRPVSEGGATFSTWLYRVVMNLCIDRKRRPRTEPIDDVPEPAHEGESAVDRIARTQVSARVAAAIQALPERQRVVIVLCVYEELSNIEAARIMSLTVGAVESLLVRAKRTLKGNLAVLYRDMAEI